MTIQEKLKKLEQLLQDYLDNDEIFKPSAVETERQQRFREDLQTVVSILFKEDTQLRSDMSVAQIKEKVQSAWKQTKPKEW
ncbi:hypothetical protein GF339_14695 [candidate division KSB3 bacterium]|uniref:Uncharacterized protein n=1 Tax=candidate division KSB3 bacterium TaxID=2044937 RepID=A0A9D5Q7F4_9BACT|nr:hypothetical protein [candidate division KSB3 bacterium]MBD3325831.1 hypothetical protein [candidate division KSB3 bacterium]